MLVTTVDMKRTGRNIAMLREKSGISVRELQKMMGFATPQAIYKWQRGETLPTIENLAALAIILKTDIREILVVEWREEEK